MGLRAGGAGSVKSARDAASLAYGHRPHFALPSQVASAPPADLVVAVYDVGGRRIGRVPAASASAEHGLITVTWNGTIEGGNAASRGVYMMRAEAPSIGFPSVRRIVVR